MDSGAGRGYRLGTMKSTKRHLVVLMTAPDLKTAREIGNQAVTAGVAVCANLIPKIESIYVWKDKLERGSEVLVLFKTTKAKLASLESLVVELHPYDTPELIAVPVSAGTAKYLAWIDAGVGGK